MKTQNFVAKYARKFNRAKVIASKKQYKRKTKHNAPIA